MNSIWKLTKLHLAYLLTLSIMVKSLNPRYRDHSVEHGRRESNYDIGEAMLATLAASIASYKSVYLSARHRPAQAAEDLLKAARHRARKEGKSVRQVLKEHIDALDAHDDASSKFILTTRDAKATGDQGQSSAFDSEMDRQDIDRANRPAGRLLGLVGKTIDARQGLVVADWKPTSMAQAVTNEMADERLAIMRAGGSGTLTDRRPAPRHAQGGVVPNADRLRMLAAPREHKSERPLRLMHNPTGGGGYHNPHQL